MHIFLDTNILHDDFFFKSIYNKKLIKLAEYNYVHIYICSTVYKETKNNYLKSIQKNLKEYTKSINNLMKYDDSSKKIESNWLVSLEEYSDIFEKRFKELFENNIINFINSNENKLLENFIDKAINKIPPFFNGNHDQCRDALIWLSYTFYANENIVNDCILLTNNSKDFADEEDLKNGRIPKKIHKNILCDTKNDFLIYNSTKELFDNNNLLSDYFHDLILDEKFENLKFISDNIAVDDIKIFINKSEILNKLDNYVSSKIENMDISDIGDNYLDGDGYVIPSGGDIQILNIKNIDKDILDDEILITGSIIIEKYVDIILYDPCYVERSEKYHYHSTDEIQLEIQFSLLLNEDKKMLDFEAGEIWH